MSLTVRKPPPLQARVRRPTLTRTFDRHVSFAQEWFFSVPPVTRTYVTGAILVTGACSLELVSPFTLYFNLNLAFQKLQLWRCAAPYARTRKTYAQ
jgi:hypothetical protein